MLYVMKTDACVYLKWKENKKTSNAFCVIMANY